MQEPSVLTLVFANTPRIEEMQNVIIFLCFSSVRFSWKKMDDILHYRANGVIIVVLYITLSVAANEGGNDLKFFACHVHSALRHCIFPAINCKINV